MSLELTENKSNIGSGALNDLLFILYRQCHQTVVADQSAISRRSVGERSATDWWLVGDWLATVSWAFVFDCRKSATFFRLVGNWSAISRRLKTVLGLSTTAEIGRRSVANQSATCRRPPKTLYDRFGPREVLLAATKTSLRPNRPCNLLQPVADQSPTSVQPPCNLPVTTQNFGRKEVANRLQAMCDRGLRMCMNYIMHTILFDKSMTLPGPLLCEIGSLMMAMFQCHA